MPMFLQSMFGRWRAMRKRRRANRDLREAFDRLDNHLLRDSGGGSGLRFPRL
jgi:hypothetical protein